MENKFYNQVYLATGEEIIDLSKDDVLEGDVRSGVFFHKSTGERVEGTNTNTVDASEVKTFASEVLEGKLFGKGNTLETGTMPNKYGVDIVIADKEGTVIPWGAYNGTSKVVLSTEDKKNLDPSNIKEGITILGVTGEFDADDMSATSKEVTATFEEQTFNPADDGVTFYSSVKVKPIPITRTENDDGGITIIIG